MLGANVTPVRLQLKVRQQNGHVAAVQLQQRHHHHQQQQQLRLQQFPLLPIRTSPLTTMKRRSTSSELFDSSFDALDANK